MTSQTLSRDQNRQRHQWPDDVLERLAEGDAAMWEDVIRAFRPCILARAAQAGLKPWQRQDLEQRVWLTLFQHATSIRDPACLPGWLSTTARRMAFNLLHEEGREIVVDEVPDRAGDAGRSEVEERCLDAQRRRELRAAIGQLPPSQRAVVRGLLRDLSYDEVSALMGVAIGSIGPTRQRALSRLRVVLEAA